MADLDKNKIAVKGADLQAGQKLVGTYGGLSEIDDVASSSSAPGMMLVETEHGPLYLDPDSTYDVLDYS